jgi:activating signal cointegrator complex subunit 1
MNHWRSTTLALLRKEAAQKMQKETAAVVEAVVAQVNSILSSISDAQSSESRDQSLRALVTSCIDLSRLLRVQKAIFSIIMPSIEGHQKTMFDAESMEDIGGEDEDTLHEREIRCVTFPGIVKTGDENGESSHLRNIVAKVRVLCAPD